MLMYSKIRNINLRIGVIFMVEFKPIGKDYNKNTYWILHLLGEEFKQFCPDEPRR